MEQNQSAREQELSKTGNGTSLSGTTGSIENQGGKEDSGKPGGENLHEQEDLLDTQESGTHPGHDEMKNLIKKPIFIATAEGSIAMEMEKVLFEKRFVDCGGYNTEEDPLLDKDEYVLLVVNPEIYQKLREQYLFSLMKEDEQDRVNQIAINEELHQKALTQALQIDEFIRNWSDDRSYLGEGEKITFNETQLRVILNKMKHQAGEKGKLTHQDAWNIMDLLALQGFLLAENLLEEIHKREKRKYRLVINNSDRLNHIIKQRDQSLYLQRKYKDQEDSLNNQIKELEISINNNDATTNEFINPDGNLSPSL